MQRERRAGLVSKDRLIAFGLVVCFGLLVWGVLQTFRAAGAVRPLPTQAPARQEPGERPHPNLDPEPVAKLLHFVVSRPV